MNDFAHRTDGSVTKRRDKFRVRVSYNKKRLSLGDFPSETDAWGAISAFWVEIEKREPTEPTGVLTVKQWGESYLNTRETDGVHRSVDRDRTRWHSRIAGTSIGAQHLDVLTTREIRAWLALQIKTKTRRGTLPRRSTVANTLNLLRVALEEAVQKGILESNPARDVRMPTIATTTEGWDWLRASEVTRFFANPKLVGEARRLFTVSLLTGLRKGELWGLRWKNIDFDRAELIVSETYDKRATKGGQPRRVPLLKPALEALKKQPRRCAAVFPTHDLRTRNRNDNAGLEGLLEDVGLRHIRFHDLRHTCASHLLMGTWAPELMERPLRLEELQKWLGHKNLSTTERYAHLCADALRGAVKRDEKGALGAGPTPGPSWTQVEVAVAEDVAQLARLAQESLEARIGIEPMLTVLQGGSRANDLTTLQALGPVLVQIGDVLKVFCGQARPDDLQSVRALISAAERIQELEAELAAGGLHVRRA